MSIPSNDAVNPIDLRGAVAVKISAKQNLIIDKEI